MHPTRNKQKRSPRPHGRVQRRKFMIRTRHRFHKILLYQIRIFLHRHIHILKNHALTLPLCLQTMISIQRVILCPSSSQNLTFCLWNSQSFKSPLHIRWYILPTRSIALHFLGRGIINQIIKIQIRKIYAPIWQLHLPKHLKRF